MGLPEGVGAFNLRVLGLATRADGQSTGDFAFHLETGLTPSIGLHVRNDRFRNNDKSEVMFQFAAFVSKDGMSGFAPIIEFEIPTRSGASRISTLVGFTSSLGSPRLAFNQVLHYDPREDMGDASAAPGFQSCPHGVSRAGDSWRGRERPISGRAGTGGVQGAPAGLVDRWRGDSVPDDSRQGFLLAVGVRTRPRVEALMTAAARQHGDAGAR